MPKPKTAATYGEEKRLTEKEKYRVLADAKYLVEQAKKLRSIPEQLDGETKISPETRVMLGSMAKDLEELNAVWKEYATSYLDVSKTQRDERDKERSSMIKLLSGLNKITKQMEAYRDEKNPVAYRGEFLDAYASIKTIAGHCHEMTKGALVVPKMKDGQMITAKKDINIVSEASIKYMISLAGADDVVGADMDYVDQLDVPLFSHEPTPDDIMQGRIGDCYFISALGSAVANNPQMIRDMMKDNGDGTVTVRLYDEKENGKLEPMYINVEKSVPVIKLRKADGSHVEEDIGARGTLWVQMLEKAFVAANIHDAGKAKFSKTERSYSDIDYGIGQSAFRLLLGKQNIKTERIKIKEHYSETENPKVMDKLFEKIRESVVDQHIMTASSSRNYMDKKLLDEYNRELNAALADQKKPKNQLSEDELKNIRKDVATKVFCGMSVSFDSKTHVPKLANHIYTLIDAYEKDGEKYVLVRNPHGSIGYKKGQPSSEADKGYCEIPLERFAGMFDRVYTAKPLVAKYYEDFSSEYHQPVAMLYQRFLDNRSMKERLPFGLGLSKESDKLGEALRNIKKFQEQPFPSKYALAEEYRKLEKAANAYLEKHRNDNMSEMNDRTNRRITMAKACVALSASFLGHLDKQRNVQADLHSIGSMMVTDRSKFITQKALNSEQQTADTSGVFMDTKASKALEKIGVEKLFDIALKHPAHEIPGRVKDEVAKSMNKKQAKTTSQKEAANQKNSNQKNSNQKQPIPGK